MKKIPSRMPRQKRNLWLKYLRRKARRLVYFLSKRNHVPGPKTQNWYQAERSLGQTLALILAVRARYS